MPADLPVEADLDAGHAVLFAARFGGQSFGDLGLHHHHHRSQRREFGEQVQKRRDRDVVRQVRHHRGRLGSQIAGADGQHVAVDHVSRWISLWECSDTVCGSRSASTGSISTALTVAAAVQQCQGERAEAGPDFQDVVVCG